MLDRSTQLCVQDAILNDLRGSVSQVDRAKLNVIYESSQPVDIAAAADRLEDDELQSMLDLLPSSNITSLVSEAEGELAMRIVGE